MYNIKRTVYINNVTFTGDTKMIKKAYQPIVSLLEANPDVKVKTLLDQVRELAAAKSAGGGSATTFHKDEATGNITAIKCYYHQKWMNPQIAEFGKKTGSASGYNPMSKDGLSKWNRQQSEYKKTKERLLEEVSAGTLAPADISARLQEAEQHRDQVIPREDSYGFDTLEECLADNAARGL